MMRSNKENEFKIIKLPKNSELILNKRGEVIGVTTSDGSFDYSSEGKDFLESKKPNVVQQILRSETKPRGY